MDSFGPAADNQMNPTHSSEEDVVDFAMQLASASVLPMVIKCALELDLLEIMARTCLTSGGHVSPLEIAAQLRTTNPQAPIMLDRVLRILATHSILTCKLRDLPDGKVERLYGLGAVCKFLTKNADGVSVAPLCLLNQDKVLPEGYHSGGIPFNKAYGMPSFEYHGTDLRFNQVFNRAMADHSTIIMKKILETYKGFEGLSTVVDIGGGTGAALSMIVSKYPLVKGINFDLPHVIENAPPISGVEHVGGDMFISVPRGDAIFMKHICHDWSDESCLMFLKKCYDALPNHGKVILVDRVLSIYPDTSLATKVVVQFDCIMLAHNPGGKERTKEEFEALAKEAGFQGFRVACCAYNNYLMELLKKA
ncbi:hypothetical protein SAY86_028657 [Trapa natans]|uniref:Caffeic acid O-methyltransferase n=1 Tax=Trapa natans TaxID=22666 RepID=A0AAN7LZW4_TRANT|nr:hypothetical protein SAY86_028657 [Trapa natans]